MAATSAVPVNRGGRPRDPQIDDAVLAATLALLEEVGYPGTTIQAVSRRSGVATPAIYRRWANRVELIETAVFPELAVDPVELSGDLRTDLQRFVDAFTATFVRPAARAAFPGLLSEYQREPEANRSVALRIGAGMRRSFRALVDAQGPGTVRSDVDPDFLLDLLVGSVMYRTFVLPFTGRTEVPRDGTADAIHQLLTTRDD